MKESSLFSVDFKESSLPNVGFFWGNLDDLEIWYDQFNFGSSLFLIIPDVHVDKFISLCCKFDVIFKECVIAELTRSNVQ